MSYRKIFPPTTSKSAISLLQATSALSQKRLRESRAKRAQMILARNDQQQQATAVEFGGANLDAVHSYTETGREDISD